MASVAQDVELPLIPGLLGRPQAPSVRVSGVLEQDAEPQEHKAASLHGLKLDVACGGSSKSV